MESNCRYQGLYNLIAVRNAHKKAKRVGRGESSGFGKTSGRGHKGQKSRKSGNVRIGFEGGQNPLLRRLPKVGFSNAPFKKIYTVVNLNVIALRFKKNSFIDLKALISCGLVSDQKSKIKLLSNGDLNFALNFKVHAASKAAIQKVQDSGGAVHLLGWNS